MSKEEIESLHQQAIDEGKSFYIDPETGNLVMTSQFLKNRKWCCNSGCRHCPYAKERSIKQSEVNALVGLSRKEAIRKVREHSFQPSPVPEYVLVTSDPRPNIIYLFLDKDNIVTKVQMGDNSQLELT